MRTRFRTFTQGNFFSLSGINMLRTAIAAAYAIHNSSVIDPRQAIRIKVGPVNVDLKTCREKVLLSRKSTKDMRERWFGADSVAFSVVVEARPRTTVRLFDVLEVARPPVC